MKRLWLFVLIYVQNSTSTSPGLHIHQLTPCHLYDNNPSLVVYFHWLVYYYTQIVRTENWPGLLSHKLTWS
ncbi:hypothetical protein FKM82_016452 [Ascaphus truei]